jgi:hypothetical protein
MLDDLKLCPPSHHMHPQVSMQLHDREGALDQAVSILRGPGQFDVVQHFCEPRFSGCCLVQVVAKRSKQIGLQ